MLPREAYWTILIAVTLFAFVKGRREEWFVAAILVLATIATSLASRLTHGFWDNLESGVLLVDLSTFASLCLVALFTRRFWPMWVAGLQLASSSAHMLRVLDAGLAPWLYAVAERFWIYPMMLILLVGTLRTRPARETWHRAHRGETIQLA